MFSFEENCAIYFQWFTKVTCDPFLLHDVTDGEVCCNTSYSVVALQSPIEYQRKESSSSAVMRPQTSRAPQPITRPYSSGPVGSDKTSKATIRNPSLPPLKISTSNGNTGHEQYQPEDRYEQSKVTEPCSF